MPEFTEMLIAFAVIVAAVGSRVYVVWKSKRRVAAFPIVIKVALDDTLEVIREGLSNPIIKRDRSVSWTERHQHNQEADDSGTLLLQFNVEFAADDKEGLIPHGLIACGMAQLQLDVVLSRVNDEETKVETIYNLRSGYENRNSVYIINQTEEMLSKVCFFYT